MATKPVPFIPPVAEAGKPKILAVDEVVNPRHTEHLTRNLNERWRQNAEQRQRNRYQPGYQKPSEGTELRQRRPTSTTTQTRPDAPSVEESNFGGLSRSHVPSGSGSSASLLPRTLPNPTVGVNPVAVGAAGAVVGLAAGGIISSAVKLRNEGATLPGSDYIGPGNPIHIDAPKDEADAIAKEHDVEYDRILRYAQTHDITYTDFVNQIRAADKVAQDKFRDDFATSSNWRSYVARHGLRLKSAVERTVGHIYPPKPGKWGGKIFPQIKNLIGNVLTRVSVDTLLNNTNSLWLDEAYLLIILFQL